MRIAIVIDSLCGGGAEKVMLTLAKSLLELKHDVVLLSLAQITEYDLPQQLRVDYLFQGRASKVDRFFKRRSSVAKLEQWFAQEQRAHGQFNLVLSNLDKSNNLLSLSSVQNVYYIIHNSIEAELARQKKLGPFAYRYLKSAKKRLNNQHLICVSNGIEQEIERSDWLRPASTRTIYNPFLIDGIRQLGDKQPDDLPSQPYIIHVGRLAKQKRHDVLFDAVNHMQSPHKLVLLCNKTDKAKKQAERFGVAHRVVLPGFQQNPYAWVKNAKALVLSSDYEGFPSVLIEALILGTPVVSTDCTHGPNEILTGELARYLAPMQNPQALAKCIDSCLQNAPDVGSASVLSQVEAIKVAQHYLALADNAVK